MTRPKTTRLWCGALAGLALLAGLPAAADELRWETRQTGEGRLLAWEEPETGEQNLAFFCRTGGRRIEIRLLENRERVRHGGIAPVDFASEGGRQRLAMKGEKQDPGDHLLLVAGIEADAAWRRLLTTGPALSVTLEGETEKVSLDGSHPGMVALFEACDEGG
jgi:hypothetical protein